MSLFSAGDVAGMMSSLGESHTANSTSVTATADQVDHARFIDESISGYVEGEWVKGLEINMSTADADAAGITDGKAMTFDSVPMMVVKRRDTAGFAVIFAREVA